MISSLQPRVALLEQEDADDNPQAAAREYYADPLGFVKWAFSAIEFKSQLEEEMRSVRGHALGARELQFCPITGNPQ